MINEHNKNKMKTFEITLQVEACSRSMVVALFEKLIKRPEVLQFEIEEVEEQRKAQIMIKNQWKIIHESDDDNGNPTLWTLEINHPKYGKYCWISDHINYFSVEVDYGGFIELKQCTSLTSAKRWVTMNLL